MTVREERRYFVEYGYMPAVTRHAAQQMSQQPNTTGRVGGARAATSEISEEGSPLSDRRTSPPPGNATDVPAALQGMLSALQVLLAQQASMNSRASVERSTTRVPRIEKPAPFFGDRAQDASDLPTFLSQCENQFSVDPETYLEGYSKVGYAVSLLRGPAGRLVTSARMDDNQREMLEDWDLFKSFLRGNFGDPDERNTARRELTTLRQLGPASSYFSEVMRLSSILGWTTPQAQEILLPQVEQGLKKELREEIVRQNKVFRTIAELREFAVGVDNRLFAFRREERPPVNRAGSTRSGGATPAPARTTPYSPGAVRPVAGGQSVVIQGLPTGIPPRYINGEWRRLTRDEYNARKNSRNCFMCGEAGHRAADCDKKPPGGSTTVKVESKN